jgi:hypothetical protein
MPGPHLPSSQNHPVIGQTAQNQRSAPLTNTCNIASMGFMLTQQTNFAKHVFTAAKKRKTRITGLDRMYAAKYWVLCLFRADTLETKPSYW